MTSETRPLTDSPLRYADFRVLWLSGILTGVGYAGETVVLGWLLLDRTDSPFVVASGIAVRALPGLLLGIPAGALADRVDRRRLIRLVGSMTALLTATLGLLQLAGVLSVAMILGLTFLAGCTRALGQAARSSYAFDIVGLGRVVTGTALMTLGSRAGAIIGSLAVGALLVEMGAGEAYLALAAAHLLSAAVLLWARTVGQSAPVAKPPVWQGVREFVAEIGVNRTLALLVILTAAVEVLGFSYQSLMPSLARDLLDVDAGGLGVLNAFGAAGALCAILLVTLRGEVRHKGIAFLVVLLAFGGALVLLGVSGSFAVALVAIALVSALAGLSDLLSQSLVQSAVQIGAVASVAGVTTALVTNGLLLVLLAAAVLLASKSIRRA